MKNFRLFFLIILLSFSLAACKAPESSQVPAAQWKVAVKLAPEQRLKYETQVKDLMTGIQNYQAKEEGDSLYAPLADYIDLGRAYEALGEYANALETYQRGLARHKRSEALVHNLGRLYEKVGEYKKAIEQYQILIKDYQASNYSYDITWAYLRAGDRKNAEKAFNQWQLSSRTTDTQIQEAIKKLREKEEITN